MFYKVFVVEFQALFSIPELILSPVSNSKHFVFDLLKTEEYSFVCGLHLELLRAYSWIYAQEFWRYTANHL